LRFDFTHHQAVTAEQLEEIEALVNQRILENHSLNIKHKPLQQAIDEGARALFGEKYGEEVRTIKMGDFSYELCGGTHCQHTGDVGIFLITGEGSAAAGIRRIEAVTGRKAVELVQDRSRELKAAAHLLSTGTDQVAEQTGATLKTLSSLEKTVESLRKKLAYLELLQSLDKTQNVNGITVLTAQLEDAGQDALRDMADRFRQRYPEQAAAVLGTIEDGSPRMVAVVTDDLVEAGLHAGDLVKYVASQVGGGGGGRPNLAFAGGTEPEKLEKALQSVAAWVRKQTGENS
jgi:alanyl-tRNA synthetase